MGIFTKLTKREITAVLGNFPGIEKQQFLAEGVAMGTVNTFYRLHFPTTNKVYYLKIDELNDETRLKNECLILRTLEKKSANLSFKIPVPLKTHRGLDYLDDGNRFTLVFPEITGRSLFGRELRPKHLTLVGEKLAELHQIIPDPRLQPHRFDRTGLKATYTEIQNALFKKHPQIAKFVEAKLNTLLAAEPRRYKSAIIHADLFPENILWVKNSFSGMLDFEAAGSGHPLFDVAVGLHALCHNGVNFEPNLCQSMLDGYARKQKLSSSDLKLTRYYLELTALRFLLTRLRDFELKNISPQTSNFKDYREFIKRFEELKAFTFS